MSPLSGRTALVTGGGRGIGRAIAHRLARDGATVVVTARTAAEVEAVAAEIGGVALVLDVTDRAAVAALPAVLAARAAPVTILVNNAGRAESAAIQRTTDALWDEILAVDATAPFTLCRALLPSMLEQGWGRIVNIASNAGLTGYAYSTAYCAAKHALVGLTRALAVELAETPITVNAVCPGWVETRIASEAVERIVAKTGRSAEQARASLERMSPQRRFVQPDEVAHAVATLCVDAARSIHGQAIAVDGGQVMQ